MPPVFLIAALIGGFSFGRITSPTPQVIVLDAMGMVETVKVKSPILVVKGADDRIQVRSARPSLVHDTYPFRWDYFNRRWDIEFRDEKEEK